MFAYFAKGSITVWLASCLTFSDSIKQVDLLIIRCTMILPLTNWAKVILKSRKLRI